MPDAARGNIYDLGYQRYDGVRLGRGYAIYSIYTHSLRSAFGLGRSPSAKVFPIGLTMLAFLPAVIQLGIGALVDNIVELFEASEYYGYTQVILALFCAAVAPELVGRDQRTRTLSLYFSRSLHRVDYAAAKYAALSTALLMLTLAPQLVLFIGNGLAANDIRGYAADEWDLVLPIVVSAILLSVFISGIALLIGSLTARRAYSTVAILAVFMLTWIIGGIVAETVDRTIAVLVLLFAPFHVMRGFTLYIFGEEPGELSALGMVDFAGWIYVLAAIGWAALTAFLLYRRYERIDA